MYIEIHDHQEINQKTLYFKLNNAFNMNVNCEENHKIVGLYAIYKDDVCLYVGQSKNLASRIATHLKGKYGLCTDIHLWNIENIGFGDYRDRSEASRQYILDNCEKWLMSKLKPIENINIDMSFKLEEDEAPDIDLEYNACITIINDKYNITITDSYSRNIEDIIIECDRANFNKELTKKAHKIIRDILKDFDSIGFTKKGYKNEH